MTTASNQNNDQAKLNGMVIATLLDIICNLKEGRENVCELDIKNHIERRMRGISETLHHAGRRVTLEIR